MFETFGVSRPAESAYRMLLTEPGLTRADLDRLLDADAGASLAELTERGLVAARADGTLRIEPPERAMDLLIAAEEAAIEARRAALAGLRDGVGDLVAEFVGGRSETFGDLIEHVTGDDAVRSRLYQIATGARRQVWTVNPGPAPSARALAASRAMDQVSRARQVRSRSVFGTEAATDAGMRAYLTETVAALDEVRLHPDPPLLLFIVDGELAVLPADVDRPGRGALVLKSPALVQPLIVLYQQLWRVSRPFEPDAGGESDTERLHRIVALLGEGQKDEAIARRLGLSVRTVRRLISVAVEGLGAESRFQAGVHAVRRGWVPAAE
ncbi:helix-turn-helix transcriptional regulator [Catellatospora tritici]|uniref:helix-turn-helix transcriptional regulator n=1 Tax=Catellatospora tritici TaxID=2851566 RepID=UPI001C2DABA5|nr:helix-turn-helix transcriptional regulator [Catellatospora tritici]MBV1850784.1 helix-turn-helix transcriptional regulator [Catellatospora tritici]MBV1851037.1 helix-turn-helix transcriptional regulator [Catellatospora tritici]